MWQPTSQSALHVKRNRLGFTLIELLAVMAVIVLLVGIAWPSVDRFAGEYRIRQETSDLRARIFDLRSETVEAGEPIKFLVEPEGSRYAIVNAEQKSAAVTELPEQVAFRLDNSGSSSSMQPEISEIPAEWIKEGGNPNELSSIGWATVAVFHPDGTAAEDSRFALIDEVGRTVRFSIRGLTGSVETSEILYEGSK